MKTLETILIDGEPIVISVSANADNIGTEELGVKEIFSTAETAFDEAMKKANVFAKGVVRRIKQFDKQIAPDTFSFSFGVQVNAKGGIITEVGGEANLVITMTYNHKSRIKKPRK